MENLVDYLIVLFFVISLLSSFFKKKKKKTVPADRVKQHPAAKLQRENVRKDNIVENKKQTRKKSPFEDMLKTMLEVPDPVVEEKKSEVDSYYEEALKNSAMMEEGTYKEEINSIVEDISLRTSIEYQENQNTYLSTIKEHHKKHSNKKAMKIRKDLLNNQSIKEYLIMSEVLGKPMALRE